VISVVAKVTPDDEARARREIEGRSRPAGTSDRGAPAPSEEHPPAGPHARSDMTNPEATPGAGTLTPPGGHDNVDSTSA
jgi:hypothetical protein